MHTMRQKKFVFFSKLLNTVLNEEEKIYFKKGLKMVCLTIRSKKIKGVEGKKTEIVRRTCFAYTTLRFTISAVV